ncbi:Aste57867_11277 [Aphanomyces stellatus]|uniref:Aste57867_11277 protein n=1 Tax=Aphanomyces stellatus TaxID=120398 RepID=A0A485KSH1_9STRA|nr:hypothetical protein As57867_011235 [Aphanomyces stellatus]VFT88139.1 Aste57867_11277 [Aphanomyces stellatus]
MKTSSEFQDVSGDHTLTRPSLGPIASALRVHAASATHNSYDDDPSCYMCMESTRGGVDSPMELIAPCACLSYVHRHCLDHWRATSNTYHAMTRCPTCHQNYAFETIRVNDADELDRQIRQEQIWRWCFAIGIMLVGSLVIWLIDRGTPAFFHLHWNGLDGKIYNWIGLTHVPRFIVYFVVSVLMAGFITGLVTILAFCHRNDTPTDCCDLCLDCTHHGCNASNDVGDCGNDFAAVVGVLVLVCVIFVGFAMMLTAIVGGVGSAIDRRGERRIRSLQVQQERVRNLRPLHNMV